MKKHFIVIVVLFVLLNAVFFFVQKAAPEYDVYALAIGNLVMAILSIASSLIVKRQLSQRPEAFVRGVYGATFLKLFVCMTGLLVYVMVNRPHIHKPSIFVLMGIYAIYTAVETGLLSGTARKVK